MKTLKNLFVTVLVLTAGVVFAQETQKIAIPLSNPNQKGSLEISVVNGSIDVVGYSGKEVIVEIETKEESKKITKGKNNMKKISVNSFEVSAEEKDNHVEISSSSWKNAIEVSIKVPQEFDLMLSAINQGDVTVTNVEGKMEVSNINGSVTMTNVSGSVQVNTVNGDIFVKLVSIFKDDPMSFTSMNGDIDLTIPSSTKASFKMKSDMGDIYTDFDMDINETKPKVKTEKDGSTYRLELQNWVNGSINGGGPEYLFKNFNGDIIIRKGT